jgi:hypothetical protein
MFLGRNSQQICYARSMPVLRENPRLSAFAAIAFVTKSLRTKRANDVSIKAQPF